MYAGFGGSSLVHNTMTDYRLNVKEVKDNQSYATEKLPPPHRDAIASVLKDLALSPLPLISAEFLG